MRSAILLVMLAACGDDGMGAGPDAPGGPDGGSIDAPPSGDDPTGDQLVAAVSGCTQISVGTPYETDDGEGGAVTVCGIAAKGIVSWTADMDIDCDGKMSTHCNLAADPAYQNETAATDSNDEPLDAATLPYVVVPSPSGRWNFGESNLQIGAVFAVVYKHQVAYAVFGDTGPTNIIGEASYATAVALGIDPDPSTGGTDGPVTYIGFTGDSAVVDPIEDHAAAVTLGIAKAKALLGH